MKVLFVSPRPTWPPDSGASQRTVALIRALCAKHDVTLATVPSEACDRLKGVCGDGLRNIVALPIDSVQTETSPEGGKRWEKALSYAKDLMSSGVPYSYRLRSQLCATVLHEIAGQCDAIFCRYGVASQLVPIEYRNRVVLDVDDLVYRFLAQQARRWPFRPHSILAGVEAIRTYAYEQSLFYQVAHTLVCSEPDLERVWCHRKSVVRNGVDIPSVWSNEQRVQPLTVVIIGTFGYGPNSRGLKWFLQEVWPHVRAGVSDAKLNVVGRGATVADMPFAIVPGVTVVGPVDSTSEWFKSAVLSIAPLWEGSGTRIKIIESLACARPVVATSFGAEGLERIGEQHGVFRVDRARAMSDRIIQLLRSPEMALDLGRIGRGVVEQEFSWGRTTSTLADDLDIWLGNRPQINYRAATG